jgi:drug/metabolite transporter (DMT)-like permease
LPVVIVPMFYLAADTDWRAASLSSWTGFVYLVVFSQFLGFIAWYRGLALGGVARVSQMQLTQVFLTMLFAGLLLGETITPLMLGFAVAVVATVAIGRRMPVARAAG